LSVIAILKVAGRITCVRFPSCDVSYYNGTKAACCVGTHVAPVPDETARCDVCVVPDRYGAAEHCVRDDQAALTNDYVVCDVYEVVDPSAGTDLGASMSALINASVSPNMHVSFK
jgi:hypothetical protein